MLQRHGIWGSGFLLSAMLDWCKRAAVRHWRLASRIACRSRMVGQENRFGVARPTNARTQVGFAGGLVEVRQEGLGHSDQRQAPKEGLVNALSNAESQYRCLTCGRIQDIVWHSSGPYSPSQRSKKESTKVGTTRSGPLTVCVPPTSYHFERQLLVKPSGCPGGNCAFS